MTQSLLSKPTQNLTYSQCKASIQNEYEHQNDTSLYTLIPCDISPPIIPSTTMPPLTTTTMNPTPKKPLFYFPTWDDPTNIPTSEPSIMPTNAPTSVTTVPPIFEPSVPPTNLPITSTMFYSSTSEPTASPTIQPSMTPTTETPTQSSNSFQHFHLL